MALWYLPYLTLPYPRDKGVSNLPASYEATIVIGRWNVPSLNEIFRLKIVVVGIAETYWRRETPEAFEQDGYAILQPSSMDKVHRH